MDKELPRFLFAKPPSRDDNHRLLDRITQYARRFIKLEDRELLRDFLGKRIKEGVDEELLILCHDLFHYSLNTLGGNYEWHLVRDRSSPDGMKLLYLSGYDASHLTDIRGGITAISRVTTFRVQPLLTFLNGPDARSSRHLDLFLIQAKNDPYLKQYIEPVTKVRQQLDEAVDTDAPIMVILRHLEQLNRDRLAEIIEVSFGCLLESLDDKSE